MATSDRDTDDDSSIPPFRSHANLYRVFWRDFAARLSSVTGGLHALGSTGPGPVSAMSRVNGAQAMDFQIQSVFGKKSDDTGKHLGFVGFSFRYTEMDQLKLVNDYKDKNGDYKTYEMGTVTGSGVVTLSRCRLYEGDKGPYIQAQGITVPYEVRNAVAIEAMQRLKEQAKANAAAA